MAIYTGSDVAPFKETDKILAGKLAALIRVKNLGRPFERVLPVDMLCSFFC